MRVVSNSKQVGTHLIRPKGEKPYEFAQTKPRVTRVTLSPNLYPLLPTLYYLVGPETLEFSTVDLSL